MHAASTVEGASDSDVGVGGSPEGAASVAACVLTAIPFETAKVVAAAVEPKPEPETAPKPPPDEADASAEDDPE